MNAIVYARYSSSSQSEQSIEGQLNACHEYAKRNGYCIVAKYIDRAQSGYTTAENRPEFQRMIKDSSKRSFDVILVYQLDRFSRNKYDSATYKAKLKKNGVKVVSVRENISDDASGILMESVLEGMAEYYSAELSQKVRRGIEISASKYRFTGGKPPLGFTVDSEKRYQIDTETAPLVVKIFELYAAGQTVKEITDYMNSLGVKTSQGAIFNKSSLRDMLINKKYLGTYSFHGKETPNVLPRIIDDELFERVQMRRWKTKNAPASARAKEEYLLTTKLFCGYCKEMMVGVSGVSSGNFTKYTYYTCKSVLHKKGCKKKNVRKNMIEDIILQRAREQLTDENIAIICKEVEKLNREAAQSPEFVRLNKLLKENATASENLLLALEKGEVLEIITKRLKQKETERKELDATMTQEKLKHMPITESEIKFFLTQLKKGNVDDIKYKRALIALFVDSIFLYDDYYTIVFKIGNQPVSIDYKLIDDLSSEMSSNMRDSAPPRPAPPRQNLLSVHENGLAIFLFKTLNALFSPYMRFSNCNCTSPLFNVALCFILKFVKNIPSVLTEF